MDIAPKKLTVKQKSHIRALWERGIRYVICRTDKSAIWPGWQTKFPGPDTVIAHLEKGGLVGFVPKSLNLIGIDIDGGDAATLLSKVPVFLHVPSQKPGRSHIFSLCARSIQSATFDIHGCNGDIRSDNGYLILWNDNLSKLAHAMRTQITGTYISDALIDEIIASDAKIALAKATRKRALKAVSKPIRPCIARLPDGHINLQTVKVGARHSALFDSTQTHPTHIHRRCPRPCKRRIRNRKSAKQPASTTAWHE